MGYDKEGRDEMAYFERQGDYGNTMLARHDAVAESLRDEDTDPVCETCGDTGAVRCAHSGTTIACPDCPTCNGCGGRLTRGNLDSHRDCWRIP